MSIESNWMLKDMEWFAASSKIFLTTFAASIAAELAEAKIDVLVIVSLHWTCRLNKL